MDIPSYSNLDFPIFSTPNPNRASLLEEREAVRIGDNITTLKFIEEANSVCSAQTIDVVFDNIEYGRKILFHFESSAVKNRYAGLNHLVKFIKKEFPTCPEGGGQI